MFAKELDSERIASIPNFLKVLLASTHSHKRVEKSRSKKQFLLFAKQTGAKTYHKFAL